ncbi:MAG: PleD family two-component system response regulator [Oscillatoria princeps RMCB-10]|jgi:diguanylate cyclase (GGDEF)-like protein|nr:PleD family two-component system response regulator [Oscillatoria princeps RMCB-10]
MSKKPAETPKGKILVVDNQPDNLRLLSAILAAQGYRVQKAISGKLALKAALAAPPDLILLDINMPEMNGYEVCLQLKASAQTCDIPVIFISGLDNVADKVQAFRVGGTDYITKPFQLEEVVVRVESQLTIRRLQMKLQEKTRLLEEQNEKLLQEIESRRSAEAALQKANEKLLHFARSDNLTEIANRRHFDEYLLLEWRRADREQLPLSLILCDIDYFKAYNDTYGHPAGDACLKRVARAISQGVSRPQDLVARYGGEEFAAILPNTSFQEAVRVASAIHFQVQQLKIPHALSPVSNWITLSQGISTTVPSHQESPETLIASADKALYEAKQGGRNQYCASGPRLPNLETFECSPNQYVFEE